MRDNSIFIYGVGFGAVIGLVFGSILGCWLEKNAWKSDAIQHGKAYYDCNTTNGTSVWKWKE